MKKIIIILGILICAVVVMGYTGIGNHLVIEFQNDTHVTINATLITGTNFSGGVFVPENYKICFSNSTCDCCKYITSNETGIIIQG